MLRTEGIGGANASAIARRAGIRQPNFYAHFKNVDDCLAAAAGHILDQFQDFNREAFQELRDAVSRGGDYRAKNLAYHRELVETLMGEPQISELYFRHRQGTSAFAKALRTFDRESVARVFEHLWDWAMLLGLPAKYVDDVRLLAETQVGNVASVMLALLDGRIDDPARAGEALALQAEATTTATFRHLLELEGKP